MTPTEHKTETLNLRVSREFKSLLQAASRKERRSMANMVEFLVADYCERHGLLEPVSGSQRTEEKYPSSFPK